MSPDAAINGSILTSSVQYTVHCTLYMASAQLKEIRKNLYKLALILLLFIAMFQKI